MLVNLTLSHLVSTIFPAADNRKDICNARYMPPEHSMAVFRMSFGQACKAMVVLYGQVWRRHLICDIILFCRV